MEILLLGASLLHADRRTDGQTVRHDAASSCSSRFCELLKNGGRLCRGKYVLSVIVVFT
jgi:hypothetical protein